MEKTERDRLRQMLLDRSMRFGEFVLSSGATSNYYIDVRKTSLHPEGLRMIAKMFYEILLPDKVTAVGGLTLGADPLVAGLMLYSAEQAHPIEGFLVRRSTKDHGLRGQVEGNLAGHRRVSVCCVLRLLIIRVSRTVSRHSFTQKKPAIGVAHL